MYVVLNSEEVPPNGSIQIILRVKSHDRADVRLAAAKLGLKPSEFMRMVVVQAARKILADRG